MENRELHTAISLPRFSRYYTACNENRRKALKLYRANIILSEKLYAIIGMIEVILRNSIDRYFVSIKGTHWLEDAVQPGGYLDVSDGCEDSFHVVQETIQKLGPAYTHGALISKLSFGFWTYQFAKKKFAAAGSTLLDIFPNRPVVETISTTFASSRYTLVLELLHWLGCNPRRILYGLDGVRGAIAAVNLI